MLSLQKAVYNQLWLLEHVGVNWEGKKTCVSSQRREDPPVGLSLEPEDRGEKTLVDLGRLSPRWTVMT